MGVEIERKFLVIGTAWKSEYGTAQQEHRPFGRNLSQGYLSQNQQVTVRVRIDEAQGFLTVKGPTEGFRRAEFEYEIPLDDARELLELCRPRLIEKRRYVLEFGGHCWEIDEFMGENSGLVIAEIELPSEDTPFARPAWLGQEVSTDPRYRNSNLVNHPFQSW
jgi:adenylate cyclase